MAIAVKTFSSTERERGESEMNWKRFAKRLQIKRKIAFKQQFQVVESRLHVIPFIVPSWRKLKSYYLFFCENKTKLIRFYSKNLEVKAIFWYKFP